MKSSKESSKEIAQLIIRTFRGKVVAQGKVKKFVYVGDTPNGVKILREVGTEWEIKIDDIIKSVDAVREDSSIYSNGPSRLKPYINNHRQSPLWALLHLLPLNLILGE